MKITSTAANPAPGRDPAPAALGRVDDYLARIGYRGEPKPDFETLAALQLAHLKTVPFENLDVFARRPVRADAGWALTKILDRGRGGWCFEVNGAFAELLEAVGFKVLRLGAAVLLGGPNRVVDHLVLEVQLDEPYLVEVGFGADAPIEPLPLNRRGPLPTRAGTFEFVASSEGTTLVRHVDGGAEPQYRFKRVDHRLSDFEPASQRLQGDRSLHWSTSPFATRLIDDDGSRLTLSQKGLKLTRGSVVERSPVAAKDWPGVLADRFGIDAGLDDFDQDDQGRSGISGA